MGLQARSGTYTQLHKPHPTLLLQNSFILNMKFGAGGVFLALSVISSVQAFSIHQQHPVRGQTLKSNAKFPSVRVYQGIQNGKTFLSAEANEMEKIDPTEAVTMPLTFDDMVTEAADACKSAFDAGTKRQIVRILLPRDSSSGDLGLYVESDANVSMKKAFGLRDDVVLVPPDETWQGGIMQLYRAAAPTCTEILRLIGGDGRNTAGVPPRIVEDRSIDESGVDGCGVLMTQSSSAKDDVSCFVQPTQEIIRTIESISEQAGERLVMLVNPQWRNIDDALDSASKNGGIFGTVASFLGGKGTVLTTLDNLGYDTAYCIEGYVCKGGNIRLVKKFDSDWVVFAENDSLTDYIRVGTSKNRPTYQDCDKMLDEKGISLKYARDIGLAPKLE